ncbi:hypothetical protein H8L32_00130 [Undibacterium sp. CY18W]|uniref:Proline-rich protein n=1 Tax=Undibacterium hunanense TaxID=2762292 RepID=A0ABR6ZIZ4_9BURK|nr:hypothetical protein [Undibacterium hunanense]MBC3915876.1 hypothetical protein [Undibacterium hunanense]
MTVIIYDKTEKGREEIATRKHQLASRLRTLLVMVDGKHSTDAIMKKVSGLGLTEQNMQELLEQDFIIEIAVQTAPAAVEAPPAAATPAISTTSTTSVPVPASSLPAMTDAERFQALYNFFNETIKSAIGLRGYGLQLKVERASSIDDFRELRQAYVEAVQKAKGPEMARSLRDRLDQLLNDGNT